MNIESKKVAYLCQHHSSSNNQSQKRHRENRDQSMPRWVQFRQTSIVGYGETWQSPPGFCILASSPLRGYPCQARTVPRNWNKNENSNFAPRRTQRRWSFLLCQDDFLYLLGYPYECNCGIFSFLNQTKASHGWLRVSSYILTLTHLLLILLYNISRIYIYT